MSETRFALVCVDSRTLAIDKELTYSISDKLLGQVALGSAVLVPVHRLWAVGYVTGFAETTDLPESEIKPISKLLSNFPLFDEEVLELARWIAKYYHCSLFEALRLIIPPGWEQQVTRRFSLVDAGRAKEWLSTHGARSKKQAQVLQALLNSAEPLGARELQELVGGKVRSDILNRLLEVGLVREVSEEKATTPAPLKLQAVLLTEEGKAMLEQGCKEACEQGRDVGGERGGEAAEEQRSRGVRERGREVTEDSLRLLEFVRQSESPVLIVGLERRGWSRSRVHTLMRKGWLKQVEVEVERKGEEGALGFERESVALTDEQEVALQAIIQSLNQGKFGVILMHGVTASGKTEVYLHAIEHAISLGKQSIFLVPEIALTAQTANIFRHRFGERVAILHSALSPSARFEEWQRIRCEKAEVVVGPRSAIFAPCRRLGLVIIDEEQDDSYKQETIPRYSARDVALVRAKKLGATVAMGSATPDVETYYKAALGRYQLVSLTKRVDERPLPKVHIIDLRRAHHKRSPLISDPLIDAMRQRLAAGEQVILFLNRRGFANFLLCPECGRVERCINCDISLTYHLKEKKLLCHHCNYSAPFPEKCAQCGSAVMAYKGAGTERLEAEVARLFPNVRVLRMDRDTTAKRGAHASILTKFRLHEADVLVGTQMVTKGLDFPDVTLVGVLNADSSLNFPDFHSAERTFQLITQVSGRAGRGDKIGEVYIQTYQPDHYAILAGARQDFLEFFRQEIQHRRQPTYPPFAHLINITASESTDLGAQKTIAIAAHAFQKAITKHGALATLLGPAPCLVPKLKGQYRWHFILRGKSRKELQEVVKTALQALQRDVRKKITVDVDPKALQ